MTPVALENESTPAPWGAAWLYVLAAVAVGAAIQRRDGLFDLWAFPWLALALAACIAALFAARTLARLNRAGPALAPWVLGLALTFEFYQLLTHDLPGSWHAKSDYGVVNNLFLRSVVGVGALGCVAMMARPGRARAIFPFLVAVYLVMGAWMIVRVPRPFMDVWVAQTEGLKALLAGHNPYTAAFPDIYNKPDLYAAGAIRDGLVHLGFPYPPIVVWLDLPGYTFAGDFRFSNLASVALAATLIAYARPVRRGEGGWAGAVGPLAAAVFLFTPRALFVLESGWTEPSTILLLAGCVFCAARVPAMLPVLLGLFWVSKQYLLFAIAPALLLYARAGGGVAWGRMLRAAVVAFVAGCVVSLPLILWDAGAFRRANFAGAAGTTFRTDASSFLALFAYWRQQAHPGAAADAFAPSAAAATWAGFSAAAIATALALWRAPRTPAGFAAAVGFIYLAFFSFFKFAFCNYYYFVVAAFCAAVGASGAVTRTRATGESA